MTTSITKPDAHKIQETTQSKQAAAKAYKQLVRSTNTTKDTDKLVYFVDHLQQQAENLHLYQNYQMLSHSLPTSPTGGA